MSFYPKAKKKKKGKEIIVCNLRYIYLRITLKHMIFGGLFFLGSHFVIVILLEFPLLCLFSVLSWFSQKGILSRPHQTDNVDFTAFK